MIERERERGEREREKTHRFGLVSSSTSCEERRGLEGDLIGGL